jgi:hypothetical protein
LGVRSFLAGKLSSTIFRSVKDQFMLNPHPAT